MTDTEKKDIVAEIKDLRQDIQMMMDIQKVANQRFDDHAQADLDFQDSIDARVEKAMKNVLFGSGKWTYRAIIVIAVIVGSLITIGGGFKMLLSWLGFTKLP